ncbi:MAG: hypothetical protein EOL98_06550 [Negativicutes bacterium]|nr:hypothetical protein [Negativicutes bacterium]
MEIYREESSVSSERRLYMFGALFLIAVSFFYEGYNTFALGKPNILGWGYSILFLGLWFWRCLFKYTYILTENEFKIVSHGFGYKRTYVVNLDDTESFTNQYVRSFFKKTKITHYIHRFSSVDPHPQRLLVFREKKHLAAVIFKGSDRFMRELRKLMPGKFLNFS